MVNIKLALSYLNRQRGKTLSLILSIAIAIFVCVISVSFSNGIINKLSIVDGIKENE
ncbi:hypothetical protein [Asaccharospora irregularis]|uniref:Uncharacterized protein n=1 Tax=Asaccharospora irregularis DSM 2635 TaxID=1121321 RepID=A0A1M5Q897_9FIRM|nr:hypothetical protein [Asaccharospora irregularis]SHH10150.1 hypothetical protein SAMN04488530_11910 [Asaccharospora irregularis DSM 2635]